MLLRNCRDFSRATWAAAVLLMLLLGVSCSKPRPVGETPFRPCTVAQHRGVAECATLQVVRDATASGADLSTVGIGVIRVPASSDARRPEPIVLLAGGPGQAGSAAFPALLQAYAPILRYHDVIIVDQRGTGNSEPLACKVIREDHLADSLADSVRTCAAKLAEGPPVNVNQYTTVSAAHDLDGVRAALGIKRWHLLGVSYGTRLALEYANIYPSHVSSLTLDSVAPRQLVMPRSFAVDSEAALMGLAAACEKDTSCHAKFPHWVSDFKSWLAKLKADNEKIRITLPDPRTGKALDISLNSEQIAQMVRGLLYSAELSPLIPATLKAAQEGDYRPLVGVGQALQNGAEAMHLPVMLSIVCREDVPFDAEPKPEEGETFLGDSIRKDFAEACRIWRRETKLAGTIPQRIVKLEPSIPVLTLSGELDPVTPPRWAKVATNGHERTQHLVAKGMGHFVSAQGCFPDVISDFLRNGPGVDVPCAKVDYRSEFFVDPTGPNP